MAGVKGFETAKVLLHRYNRQKCYSIEFDQRNSLQALPNLRNRDSIGNDGRLGFHLLKNCSRPFFFLNWINFKWNSQEIGKKQDNVRHRNNWHLDMEPISNRPMKWLDNFDIQNKKEQLLSLGHCQHKWNRPKWWLKFEKIRKSKYCSSFWNCLILEIFQTLLKRGSKWWESFRSVVLFLSTGIIFSLAEKNKQKHNAKVHYLEYVCVCLLVTLIS